MDETTEERVEEQNQPENKQANTPENWLESFTGQRVTVITLQGTEERTDPGELLRISDGWVQLVKDNGEMILVPTTAIRIIKLLDMTQTTAGLPITNQTQIDNHIYEPAAQIP